MSPATEKAIIWLNTQARLAAIRCLRRDMAELEEMNPDFRRAALLEWCDHGIDAGACFACGA